MKRLTSTKVGKPIKLLIATHTSIRAILRNDQTIRTQRLARIPTKHIPLHQHLIIRARVDRLVDKVLVQVVVDVLVAEAPRGPACAHVAPVVVVVGDVQVAKVDVAPRVLVADERRLPVVVEVVP